MTKQVHVVVLNWNNAAATLACVAAIEAQDYPDRKIVVVDNGSDPGSVAALRAQAHRFALICNGANLGFAGGCNVGMRHAVADGADYVWLLNNDAEIAADALGKLVAAAEADPGIGLLSPVLCDTVPPHAPAAFCGRFDRQALTYEYTASVETARAWQESCPDRLTLMGTALLIRRAVIETIGGLDEAMFAYWEDTDYSVRASAAGFACRIDFGSAVRHPVKRTYDGGRAVKPYFHYYMARNEILLLRKHGSLLQRLKALRWRLRQQVQVARRLGDDREAVQAVLAGIWDGWTGRGGMFDAGRRMPAAGRWLLGA